MQGHATDDFALRTAMVKRLTDTGVVRTAAVESALRHVPRHRFVPEVDFENAYVDNAVVVKRAGDGSGISSASQPTMVAIMLEQLAVAPGQRVLEIGTGTGYNAALLSTLVRPDGGVVSVEIEPDLAERAGRALAEVGVERVQVVVGDGKLGHAPAAPYDRVIVTTGARTIAGAWVEQLVDGGRLVVPIVDETGVGSVIAFEIVDGELVRLSETACGFLLMRDRPSA